MTCRPDSVPAQPENARGRIPSRSRGSARQTAIGSGATGLSALRLAVAALSIGSGATAIADMYTWKDPVTGRTYMTNLPPPWLRGPKPGQRIPKVEVMRDGRVMDPATAFAKPEAPQVPTRRRAGDAEEAAGAQAGVRGASQATGGAGATGLAAGSVPAGVSGVPIGAPPPGMMLVPVPGAQNPGVQDPPTQMNVPVTLIR